MQLLLTEATVQAETSAACPDAGRDARLRQLEEAQLADQVCRRLRRSELSSAIAREQHLRDALALLLCALLFTLFKLIERVGGVGGGRLIPPADPLFVVISGGLLLLGMVSGAGLVVCGRRIWMMQQELALLSVEGGGAHS